MEKKLNDCLLSKDNFEEYIISFNEIIEDLLSTFKDESYYEGLIELKEYLVQDINQKFFSKNKHTTEDIIISLDRFFKNLFEIFRNSILNSNESKDFQITDQLVQFKFLIEYYHILNHPFNEKNISFKNTEHENKSEIIIRINEKQKNLKTKYLKESLSYFLNFREGAYIGGGGSTQLLYIDALKEVFEKYKIKGDISKKNYEFYSYYLEQIIQIIRRNRNKDQHNNLDKNLDNYYIYYGIYMISLHSFKELLEAWVKVYPIIQKYKENLN